MSHLALCQRLGFFRTISSLPFVLWPHRLSRALLLSLRQRIRLHDRSRTCLRNCFSSTSSSSSHTSNPHTMSLSPPGSSGRLPACITLVSTSTSAELPKVPPVSADSRGVSHLLDVHVSSHLFCLTGHSNRRIRTGEFILCVQSVLDPLRVHRVVLHPCSNPASTFFRVKLSDHQATSAAQRRSKFRHVLPSDVCVCRSLRSWFSSLSVRPEPPWFTIGKYLAGATGLGSTSTRPSCRLQGFPRIPNSSSQFQRSSLFRLRMPRHVTTATASLTMCSPVLVLKPSQQPYIQFTASFLLWSSSLVWLEQDLLTERCDLLTEWFASDTLMSRLTVAANVERRHCPCCMTYKPCSKLSCQVQSSHHSVVH